MMAGPRRTYFEPTRPYSSATDVLIKGRGTFRVTMVKFILGLVTGVVIVFLSFVLLILVLLRFREKPPEIAANTALVLRLSGDIPEKPPVELPGFLGASETPLTVTDIYSLLRKAAADSNIRALVIEPDGISAGWGKLEELRSDIEQFHKTGKPVYAYLRQPTTREYYVSLPADRIILGDEEPVFVKGLRAEVMYFKKTLDKIGVSVDVEHAGKYKDFGDMFTRTDMSPETREVIGGLVDDLYGNLLIRIAAARKKTPDQVRALIDSGPFTATQALQNGLVDEIRFEDQMWGEIRNKLGGGVARVSAAATLACPIPGRRAQPHRGGCGIGRYRPWQPVGRWLRTGHAYFVRLQPPAAGGGKRFQYSRRCGTHRFGGRRSHGIGRDVA